MPPRPRAALPLLLASLASLACGGKGGKADAGPPASTATLQAATGVQWSLYQGSGFGAVTQLSPDTPPPATVTASTTAVQAAQAFLATYAALFQIQDPAAELSLVGPPQPDSLGITWVSLQQQEDGVPVADRRVLAAYDSEGRLGLVWSGYVPGLQKLSTTPAQTAAQALASAQAALSQQLGSQLGTFVAATTPALVIAPLATQANLAYVFLLTYTGTVQRVVVDAQTGALLLATDPRRTSDPIPYTGAGSPAGGGGSGVLGDAKSFTVFQANGLPGNPSATVYFLQELMPGTSGQIWGLASFAGADANSTEVSSADGGSWTSGVGNGAPGVISDAYVYLLDAEQWWQHGFGRQSYDNANHGIEVYLDPSANMTDDAEWDDSLPGIRVGYPKLLKYASSGAVDEMAHEYTHAVNDFALNTTASGTDQALALDEGLADEFGQFVELDSIITAYTSSPAIDGEAVENSCKGGSCLGTRNLQSPHATGPSSGTCVGQLAQPDNLFDPLWTSPSAPACIGGYIDEHYRDGVPNNAWYLATFGGANETSGIGVLPMGATASEGIYGNAMLGGCAGSSGACGGTVTTFLDFANVLAAVAKMAYGPGSSEVQAVGCSWYATGVATATQAFQTWGASACQCPGPGSFCGIAGSALGAAHQGYVWNGDPGSLYQCDAQGNLTGITACSSDCTHDAIAGNDSCATSADGGPAGTCVPSDARTSCCPLPDGTPDLCNDSTGNICSPAANCGQSGTYDCCKGAYGPLCIRIAGNDENSSCLGNYCIPTGCSTNCSGYCGNDATLLVGAVCDNDGDCGVGTSCVPAGVACVGPDNPGGPACTCQPSAAATACSQVSDCTPPEYCHGQTGSNCQADGGPCWCQVNG